MLRKVIDNSAFGIYQHWVKKGEGQNRAALFEHYPMKEAKKATRSEGEEGQDQGQLKHDLNVHQHSDQPVKFY